MNKLEIDFSKSNEYRNENYGPCRKYITKSDIRFFPFFRKLHFNLNWVWGKRSNKKKTIPQNSAIDESRSEEWRNVCSWMENAINFKLEFKWFIFKDIYVVYGVVCRKWHKNNISKEVVCFKQIIVCAKEKSLVFETVSACTQMYLYTVIYVQ